MSVAQSVPYGLWSSPISPAMLSQRVRLNEVLWDRDGRGVVWLEGRSDRGVLVAQSLGDARRDLTVENSVRGGVGYGGGEFCVAQGQVIFADRDGRLYRTSLGAGQPQPITPPFGSTAAPAISPDGRRVAYVFSDGKTDLVGLVDVEGRDWPVQLARGADFYMSPVWHPGGAQLAWVEWNHPNMPWDGSRLKLAQLAGDPLRVQTETVVAGDDHTPVMQPCFSPDGRYLSYIITDDEWDRLLVLDLQDGQTRCLVGGDGMVLTELGWVQGVRSMGWSADSQRIFYVRYQAGSASLWQVDLQGRSQPIDVSPYTWIHHLSVSPVRDELVFIASAANQPDRVVHWDGQRLHTLARSEAEMTPAAFLPAAQPISWLAPDGRRVHGLFYAPCNPDFCAEGLPPAILNIHGGPTSQHADNYTAEIAYFTSRGYGWLEVNYRGSSGYGRSYQDALKGNWGQTDVEDALGGAQALTQQGLADGKRLVIRGGSAGGYTVLNALVRAPGVFRAGLCLYGVSNLFMLNMDTHKFEAHYNDSLIGPLPQAAERFRDWSPAFHADSIRDPLAIFQGSVDPVVPPSQSEEMLAALQRNGVPHLYRLYEGEGHGFRKSETIADYLQQAERFLLQHVLFAG